MRFHRTRLLTALALLATLAVLAYPAVASAPNGALYSRTQRFGIGVLSDVRYQGVSFPQSLGDYRVLPLKVGWYVDWQYSANPPRAADATLEYMQMLNVRAAAWPPNWTEIQQVAQGARTRGATWIVGNEPEAKYGQGNRTPAEYADIYYEAYTKIKGWDPSAKIAIGGVIQPTPLRLRWLDEAMAAYLAKYGTPMPVDVWNIHMQVLREVPGEWGAEIPAGLTPLPGEAREYTFADCASPAVFKTLVTEFRTWMAARGQRNKPLIISEMGVLQPSEYLAPTKEQGDQLVEAFMVEVFDWLLQTKSDTLGYPTDQNLLVQRWLWYSLNDSFYNEDVSNYDGFNGSLYDFQTKQLTRFGQRLAAYQAPFNNDLTLSIPLVLKRY
jgi:hypothetical protein